MTPRTSPVAEPGRAGRIGIQDWPDRMNHRTTTTGGGGPTDTVPSFPRRRRRGDSIGRQEGFKRPCWTYRRGPSGEATSGGCARRCRKQATENLLESLLRAPRSATPRTTTSSTGLHDARVCRGCFHSSQGILKSACAPAYRGTDTGHSFAGDADHKRLAGLPDNTSPPTFPIARRFRRRRTKLGRCAPANDLTPACLQTAGSSTGGASPKRQGPMRTAWIRARKHVQTAITADSLIRGSNKPAGQAAPGRQDQPEAAAPAAVAGFV